ncbi:alpha/beta hydrolase [Candidatus Peregrinibacteria bacterium]|nr:alpha/beta hydrolase [Candidatus Peregrinibacteria bacterium]
MKIVDQKYRPLLILHGWRGSSESWTTVKELLTKQGFRVYAPDLPGFGKSEAPGASKDGTQGWSVDDYVEAVQDMMRHWKLSRVSLLGHSFGGRIAIKLASQHPEKVEKLILVASAGIKNPPSLRMRLASVSAVLGKRLFSLPFLRPFSALARRALYGFSGSHDYEHVGKNRETFLKVISEDLRPYLSRISAPTLILWGDRDKMTPATSAHIMAKEIPNATLKIFPEVRHGVHLEVPEELAKSVSQFLNS